MQSVRNMKSYLPAALWANALMLGGIAVVLCLRSPGPSWVPAALGAPQPSISGGGGIYVMPAQLAQNQWGCYLLDIDRQTLVAYQYSPSNHQLTFVAARNYRYDVQLHDYATEPSTKDMQKLIEMENASRHNADLNQGEVAPPPEVHPGGFPVPPVDSQNPPK
jgi:hypothetical protein